MRWVRSLLGPFKPNLQEYTKKALEERGVQVHLGEGVVEIEPTRVHLKSGAVVKAHTLVWGAGIAANPLAGSLGEELARGRVVVEPDLSLKGHPEVFVVGDIAMITDSKTGAQLPQLGSVALQAGIARGSQHRTARQGQGDRAVQIHGQGHDGHDRAWRRCGAVSPWPHNDRPPSLAGMECGPLDAPVGR